MPEPAPIDLLVLGGGITGLSAAAWAATNGATVTLVEKAPRLGGTSLLSEGVVWTAPSLEILRGNVPDGKAELAAAMIEDYPAAMDWVRSLGVEVRPPVTVSRFGRGHRIDISGYIREAERRLLAHRGKVITGATTEDLLLEGGRVVGVRLRQRGEEVIIHARWTFLATGGFAASPELRASLLHPNGATMQVRGNPHSTGDGLRLGRAAGAAIGFENASFYGHLVPYPTRLDDLTILFDLTQAYSGTAVLVNTAGRRFTDESLGDPRNAQAVLRQPGGKALLIADESVMGRLAVSFHDEEGPPPTARDRFDFARRHGANIAVAADIDDLALLPAEWGYDGPAVVRTLGEYNWHAAAAVERLEPNRAYEIRPLDRPPYHLMEVQAAITSTYRGLMINAAGQVLDGRDEPIPGLLAGGADAGGVTIDTYCGSLSWGLVFGIRAARMACAPPLV